ncbi:hypothetical protein BGC30_08320 [Novacetimonas hansenii]|nr:hypothetical protein BGC30_08320 [Novacetimonas hansenii]
MILAQIVTTVDDDTLKRAATYGSARWAEDAEIREAGLLGEDGVVLGKYRRAYLRHDGPEHVLTFAPTRTGKGVGTSASLWIGAVTMPLTVPLFANWIAARIAA